ncbi:glutathione S-transferase family protein [Vitiosangium sp. GDMCC 1.1324]|uniref:glutathione S-transferase family protein n=1 Tax=Vitiosangium sp. (strain GDMCC 1.1324) TaxID=2138576 RepID=UPI000D35D940|nr:glutathione S-transferase family protein [Vitiosangium sp. GDMCC 1.1324]PTL79915.1 glutathione S-transferase family protein [Vitiosangium sp. GDMCC 1.1324]
MKLYYSQHTRGHRPRWVLEELGIPYELHRLDLRKGEHKSPEYQRIHPLGLVPALEDEGRVLVESGAICLHLADKYPEKTLAPAPGTPERGEYYQWVMFALVTLEPSLSTFASHTRFLPEAERQPVLAERAKQQFLPALRMVEQRISGREYIVGNAFSVADVLLSGALSWGTLLGLFADFPGLQAYTQRLMERPAAKRAYAD